jgi:hypothetical protein
MLDQFWFRASRTCRAAIVAGMCLLAGCGGLPTQEMSDARQAIAAAREAGAETYAAFALGSAERLLAQAHAALLEGEYDLSRQDALAAHEEANRARQEAITAQAQGSDATTAQ